MRIGGFTNAERRWKVHSRGISSCIGDVQRISFASLICFSRKEPYVVEEVTYTDSETNNQKKTVTWNHGPAVVLNGLLCNGLRIESFGEYDYSPFNLFGNMTYEKDRTFKIAGMNGEIPMLFFCCCREASTKT